MGEDDPRPRWRGPRSFTCGSSRRRLASRLHHGSVRRRSRRRCARAPHAPSADDFVSCRQTRRSPVVNARAFALCRPRGPSTTRERDGWGSSAIRHQRPAIRDPPTRDLTHLSLAPPTRRPTRRMRSDPKERARGNRRERSEPLDRERRSDGGRRPRGPSLTIAYVLPDDTEHACEAFSVPATRKSGAACAVKWDGPESGHELAVTEQTMRAYAAGRASRSRSPAKPRFVVPGTGAAMADPDAGTDGETNGLADEDENAAPEPGRADRLSGGSGAGESDARLAPRRDGDVRRRVRRGRRRKGARAIFARPPRRCLRRCAGSRGATITVSLDRSTTTTSTEKEKPNARTEMEKQPFLPPAWRPPWSRSR